MNAKGNCDPISVTNCTTNYTNWNSCYICASGYYPSNLFFIPGTSNTCVGVSTISGCTTMKANRNYCETCAATHLKVENGKKCLNLTKDTASTYIFPKDCTTMNSSLECTACTNFNF